MHRWLPLAAGALSLGLVTAPAPGIVGGSEPSTTDTRFDAVAAFSRTEWIDDDHNTYGNATLIEYDGMDPAHERRLVLFAKHLLGNGWNEYGYTPPAADVHAVRFRRKPDGSLGSIPQGAQSFHMVKIDSYILFAPSWLDIAIGVLEEPVTHIDPIHVEDMHAFEGGADIILAGWGMEGPGFIEGPRGRLLLAGSELTSVDEDLWSHVHFMTAWNPDNPCSCGPNMFDSGGAVLVEHEDDSLGIIAVITTIGGGTDVRPAFQPELYPPTICPEPIIICLEIFYGCADLDADNEVGSSDLGLLLGAWGTCTGACPEDLDRDGEVGSSDLGLLMAEWGVADCVNPCHEVDLNDDGEIDGGDMGLLLAGWGECPECDCCPGDFDSSGEVDGADLGYLLSFWGACSG